MAVDSTKERMSISVVDPDQIEWQAVPGTWEGKVGAGEADVRYKAFATGSPLAPSGQLVEYEAGHVEAPHSHDEGEIYVMLAGDLAIDDVVVGAGMLVYIEAGTVYGPSTTEQGCRFVRLGLAEVSGTGRD